VTDRIPIYELHIRPLFRLVDREHMSPFFNLWDYDAVKQNATKIQQRLRSSMPPAILGGPWPPELVTMFGRWVTAGCPRLVVGKGANYQLTRSGTSYHLECNVQVPSDTMQAWLDIVDTDPTRRTYRLYIDPSGAGQGAPGSLTISDDFDDAANISAVQVIDASGTQTVTLSTA
jgi:hypothetical protein